MDCTAQRAAHEWTVKQMDKLQFVYVSDCVNVAHGQWTERHVDTLEETTIDAWQSARCSVCGLYHTTPYLYSFTDYKFCPNCGARMKEDEER